ncbi:substrate-binding periplasmic protein [Pelomonas sp. Root1237]|uniref:substrate-binding periplasmic protein n=1 Tax=Pelomonas sp. Root1237 TaxID=1736434 RepID=UPI00071459AB|nr:transporter substrate-binding domain-containing protein [Pelomonas sp. Root1237]KQV86152.1 hypothetical protein ASC91_23605 [Pelomonas sp. Root1237]
MRPISPRLLLAIAVAMAGPAAAAEVTLRFLSQDFPPYVEREGQQARGPFVRLVMEGCARLGWKCSVEVLPWRRAQAAVERGEAEGIFPLLDTPQRRQIYHLSQPVVGVQMVFFTRVEQDFFYRDPASLGTQRIIGVFGPSGTATVLQDIVAANPNTMVVEPDNTTVLRKLLAGRYGEDGVALINRDVAWHLADRSHLTGLREAGVAHTDTYRIGLVRKRVSAAQANAFMDMLAEMCTSPAAALLLAPELVPSAACGAVPAKAAR